MKKYIEMLVIGLVLSLFGVGCASGHVHLRKSCCRICADQRGEISRDNSSDSFGPSHTVRESRESYSQPIRASELPPKEPYHYSYINLGGNRKYYIEERGGEVTGYKVWDQNTRKVYIIVDQTRYEYKAEGQNSTYQDPPYQIGDGWSGYRY